MKEEELNGEMNNKKHKIEKYYKEIDLGGYPLFIAPVLKEELSNKDYNTKDLAKLIRKEYKEICHKTPFLINEMNFQEKEKNYPTSCKYSNYNKNRYKDVLATEKTRFKFFKPISSMEISLQMDFNTILEEDENKYINANFIKGSINENTVFISTQGEENLFFFFFFCFFFVI